MTSQKQPDRSGRLLLIIPAFNEEESIGKTVENIRLHYPEYDYIIINDGSSDRTSEICHERGYHIVDQAVNLGLSGAFQTGMRYAFQKGYGCAMQFDADGQHRPEYIKAMWEKLKEGYDIVIGSRFVTKEKPYSPRMIGSRLIAWAIRMTTGHEIKDPTSGMRLFGRNAIREFAVNINYDPEPDTVSFLIKSGMKVTEVQADMAEREAGHSYLTFTRSLLYMLRMMISILLIQNFRERK